nr:unnamed protein product [Callosobruchus analis]
MDTQVSNASISVCRRCKQKHNLLLHDAADKPQNDSGESLSSIERDNSDNNSEVFQSASNVNLASQVNNSIVLLPTVVARVYDSYGKGRNIRTILDSGSQSCYVSERLLDILSLNTIKADIRVSVLTLNNFSIAIKSKCQISFIHYTMTIRFHNNEQAIKCCDEITSILQFANFKLNGCQTAQ